MTQHLDAVLTRIEEIKGRFETNRTAAASGSSRGSAGAQKGVLPYFPDVLAEAISPQVPESGGGPVRFEELIGSAAAKNGLDPALLKGLVRAESNFRSNAVSPARAVGLTQLMPGTARSLGVSDPYDPVQNIEGGAKYLRQQLDRFGDVKLALAAYNAGPGAVKRYGGIPPYTQTQNYVKKVLGYAQGYGFEF
jgi:soluble lytic murein transglycosylase-like protein